MSPSIDSPLLESADKILINNDLKMLNVMDQGVQEATSRSHNGINGEMKRNTYPEDMDLPNLDSPLSEDLEQDSQNGILVNVYW
jgi:hypothetical protein